MDILPIPFADPVSAFAPWAQVPWAMLLDSAAFQPERGRYAYIVTAPFRTLVSAGRRVEVDGTEMEGDPFTILGRELAGCSFRRPDAPFPFTGGAVGLFGYEAGGYLERAPARHRLAACHPAACHPDVAVGLYDAVAAYDLKERRACVIASRPEAREKAAALARRLSDVAPLAAPQSPALCWRPELTREAYLDKVARILAYIEAGEVFQVNLTQRFLAPRPAGFSPFDAYRRLRAANPAPFAAFLRLGEDFTVASASPERFLSLSAEGRIQTRPIKGTRTRGATAAADRAAMAELAASAKDHAENLMITDLMRNDIGRSAVIGSVTVPTIAGIESFASLHHLVSVVEGRLRPDLAALDLLRGAFPGGSVTGAPKVRAMEIIDELEVAPRGPYCGTIAWIGFDGAMDSSIVIRALVMTEDQIIAQAGGAIVADSDPAAEHAEMMAKVRPALAALAAGGDPCWPG